MMGRQQRNQSLVPSSGRTRLRRIRKLVYVFSKIEKEAGDREKRSETGSEIVSPAENEYQEDRAGWADAPVSQGQKELKNTYRARTWASIEI